MCDGSCNRMCICKICRKGPCAVDKDCDIPYSILRQCHASEDIRFGIQKCNMLLLDFNLDFDKLKNKSFYIAAQKKYNFTQLVRNMEAEKKMNDRLNQPLETESKSLAVEEEKKSSSYSIYREGRRRGDRRSR